MLTIGIAGGTGAGKTTIIKALRDYFGKKLSCISHDNYYRELSHLTLDERHKVNFDHPDSLETNLLISDLKQLKKGQSINIPQYDFKVSNRTKETEMIVPTPVVIVEGILIFENKVLRELMDIKVFVDAESDTRLGRRILRDINERGRTLEFCLNQYLNVSKPMHEQFVEPYKKYADVIIPQGGENRIAIQMLIHTIERHLK